MRSPPGELRGQARLPLPPEDAGARRPDALRALSAGVLATCLVLGGGTRHGFLSDAIVQFAAIPLLLAAIARLGESAPPAQARWALVVCAAAGLVPLAQLAPLPPALWRMLPAGEEIEAAYRLVGREPPWRPVSISPGATWLGALSLLPPLAIFLATIQLGYRERRLLVGIVLAAGMASAVLGLAQLAQGPASALRFYAVTNRTEAVGFFANRNHFAALLYALVPLAAACMLAAGGSKAHRAPPLVPAVMGGVVLVALVAAQAMARSRAGLVLTVPALVGGVALVFTGRDRPGQGAVRSGLLLAMLAAAAVLSLEFALYRAAARFAADPLADARLGLAGGTLKAGWAFMPLGSGIGTFVPAYALFEKPEALLAGAYANRAHSDILELWLETGVAGVVLMAVLAAWLVARGVELWRWPPPGAGPLDHALARGATLAAGLLAVHSLVDYPLRTAALMALFAFACGLMVPPPGGSGGRAGSASRPPFERWGEDIAWPPPWRAPPTGSMRRPAAE